MFKGMQNSECIGGILEYSEAILKANGGSCASKLLWLFNRWLMNLTLSYLQVYSLCKFSMNI